MKRKTEITLEIEEKIVLRQGEMIMETFCERCQALANMASPQIASMLSSLSEREIFRLIEADAIHFVETGRIFVCLNSLVISKE